MRSSFELQFDALREGGGTREVGKTVAKSLVLLYQGGYAPGSAKAEANSNVDESR